MFSFADYKNECKTMAKPIVEKTIKAISPA